MTSAFALSGLVYKSLFLFGCQGDFAGIRFGGLCGERHALVDWRTTNTEDCVQAEWFACVLCECV